MGNARMEADMAKIIGESIIESVNVVPKREISTFINKAGLMVLEQILGGAVGGAVVGAIEGATTRTIETETGNLKGPEQVTQEHLKQYPRMMLAISSSQVAFFEMKVGFIRNSIGELILKIPRWSIVKFETVKNKLACLLLIEVQNNRQYEVETFLGNLPKLRRIIEIYHQTQKYPVSPQR